MDWDCYGALISAGSLLGGEHAQTPGSSSHRAGVGLELQREAVHQNDDFLSVEIKIYVLMKSSAE